MVIKYTVQKLESKTIIGTYSQTRAAKDKHGREGSLEKAEKILKNLDLLKKGEQIFSESRQNPNLQPRHRQNS